MLPSLLIILSPTSPLCIFSTLSKFATVQGLVDLGMKTFVKVYIAWVTSCWNCKRDYEDYYGLGLDRFAGCSEAD